MTTRALVLGGGGVTGIAWELGVLTALKRAGVVVQNADIVVGTSAGSVVGAQITSGADLEDLYATQVQPAEQSGEIAGNLDLTQFQQMIMDIIAKVGMNPQAIRAEIGQKALTVQGVSEEERRAVIEARLPSYTWPTQRLLISAVEVETGNWTVFDHHSGVTLVDAVAASCAVPLVWPPVTIYAGSHHSFDGVMFQLRPVPMARHTIRNYRHYIDGGMRSGTNADLAKGCDKVLILTPLVMPVRSAQIFGSDLEQEKELLEADGSQVMVIGPNEYVLQIIGPNVLDPARRAPTAIAALEQGETLVNAIREFWNGA